MCTYINTCEHHPRNGLFSVITQITKKKVDYVLTSSKPPEEYPMKLFLDVLPVGENTSRELYKLAVLGLDEELSFTLTVGTMSSMFTYWLAQNDAMRHNGLKLEHEDVPCMYQQTLCWGTIIFSFCYHKFSDEHTVIVYVVHCTTRYQSPNNL